MAQHSDQAAAQTAVQSDQAAAEHAATGELADQAAATPGELARSELAERPVIVGRTTLHRYAWFVR